MKKLLTLILILSLYGVQGQATVDFNAGYGYNAAMLDIRGGYAFNEGRGLSFSAGLLAMPAPSSQKPSLVQIRSNYRVGRLSPYIGYARQLWNIKKYEGKDDKLVFDGRKGIALYGLQYYITDNNAPTCFVINIGGMNDKLFVAVGCSVVLDFD